MWLNCCVRIIYLSPHLDDAVLSAGGLIHTQAASGTPVETWVIMAGIPHDADPPFAQVMHHIWGFRSALECMLARRTEDRRAVHELGARTVHFDFLDALYRRGPNGEPLYSDVMVPPVPGDDGLPARIAEAIAARLRPDDRIVCQLGIGGHADHILVRRAAEMLDRPLLYDADMPYVINHPRELQPSVAGMRETFEPIPDGAYPCWISAIECYASQVDSVYGSHEQMHEMMDAYWAEQHGVRFWSAG